MLGGPTGSAAAQTGSAALTGVIHDATAQPVAGAAVVVTAVATGAARSTTTESDGRYSVVRLDTFNLLNMTPFGQPNGVVGTPAFGTITTAGDPRVVQLAVKLSW